MSDNSAKMNRKDRAQAEKMEGVKTSVIYEAIRADGDHELSRSVSALWWSGVMAGVGISLSLISMAFLHTFLPDAAWTPAVVSLGYPIGFLVVILGRMQLFTENTVTPILSLFFEPTPKNFLRTARLWGIVFIANVTGCFLAAALLTYGNIVPEPHFESVLTLSQHYGSATAIEHLTLGMPAGFLIASIVWILPRMDTGGEVMIIFALTYVIGLGGLSHVVAGSIEMFVLVLNGDTGLIAAITNAILPAFLGNALGGTGLFAVLTYAQVREEV